MVNEWLVFFSAGPRRVQWITRKGFGHVQAVGYDPELDLWVSYDPSLKATLITVCRDSPAFHAFLGSLGEHCRPNILRFAPRADRRITSPLFCCTGAIKSLLGIRSRALWPHGLFRDLVARGASLVEPPAIEVGLVSAIRQHEPTDPAAGRS